MSKRPEEALFLAKRLRALRKQAGLSQEGLAEHAGISYKMYQSYEAGRRWNLRLSSILKLAAIHGLTLSSLFSSKTPRSKLRKA
jgi:transcriptional regulator with XRE-family HTH domain